MLTKKMESKLSRSGPENVNVILFGIGQAAKFDYAAYLFIKKKMMQEPGGYCNGKRYDRPI